MPVLEVMNHKNERVGEIRLDDGIFDGRVREHLIHEVVVMQLAARRSGSASAKTRSEVKGTTAKPWRQKGTGRARAGRRRSPLWRHGGVIFPPQPRSYEFRPPKKVRRAALISALNRKLADGNLKVLDTFVLPDGKSSEIVKLLDRLNAEGKVLCVTAELDAGLRRARAECVRCRTRERSPVLSGGDRGRPAKVAGRVRQGRGGFGAGR